MEIKKLTLTGYTPRMVIAFPGLQKTGKSHFALTAPKGMFYANFDKQSREDVLPKFQGQFIRAEDYWITDYTDKVEAKKLLDRFWADFHDALATAEVRSIVVDTTTELRRVILSSVWGKDNQLKGYQYTPAHDKIRELVSHVNTSDKNVIFVHQMKKEYKAIVTPKGEDSIWTGRYELAGFDGITYLSQVNMVSYRVAGSNPTEFGVRVVECSLNREIEGLELEGEMSNFPTLASLVFPESDMEDWV